MLISKLAPLVYPKVPKVNKRWNKSIELKGMHFWSKEKIDEYIGCQKTKILRHAAQYCPYYIEIFKKNSWDPKKAELYWDEWPILTQQLLQENRDKILSTVVTPEDMVLDSSGGSSGFVKTFYHSKDYMSYSLSSAYHTDSIAGWTPGCKTAYLWAAPCDTKKHLGILPRLKSKLQNIRLYDSFDMSDDKMALYHKELTSYKPEVIIAIAGSIYQMARYLRENNIVPNYPRKGIVTSAETLTDEMRETIESVFGKIVFNRYGCRETGLLAFEDEEHKGLHVNFPGNFVEICKHNTTVPVWEDEGDVLITTLTQKHFPLIRYQVGDVAIQTKDKCSCGRNSQLLRKVSGRSSDFVTAINGSKIHGEYFSHILRVGDKVRQYTAIQKESDLMVIDIVLAEALSNQERQSILNSFRNNLGEEMRIEFNEVDYIPPLPSGKRRFVISLID
jgi:phenylacetate-CoA ligase